MEQQGLTVKDLEPAIGKKKKNRVYEVLNGTRSLTLPMIRRLHNQFGIPLESFGGIIKSVSHLPDARSRKGTHQAVLFFCRSNSSSLRL